MKRNKFSLSHYRLATMGFGLLTPISWYEALPADTIQQRTNLLIRMTPLTAPVMHPVKVRIHTWFVPNRIIWDNWEDFITGGESGNSEPAVPTKTTTGTVSKGSLINHMGIPAGDYTGNDIVYSALPFRAYAAIYNEFYRDQQLVDPIEIGKGDGDDPTTPTTMLRCSWEKDYFTTARPQAQLGDQVLIPIGTSAPVVSAGDGKPAFTAGGVNNQLLDANASNRQVEWTQQPGNADDATWWDPKLEADLSQATGIPVNTLRTFLAQQRFQEARAQFGARYSEYLKYLAPGIGNLDSRLQEPEYLGGGSNLISFSEVLQTESTQSGSTPLATMGGHAISTMRTRPFRKFIPEHGIIMTLMSVVPKAIYTQQVDRKWQRLSKEMYFQKELQWIGEQPVTNREVYAFHSDNKGVFGYQQRYDEYRYVPSSIVGDFTDNIASNWHYGRIHESDVGLNKSFIECNPAMRPSADQSNDPLYVMANHSIQARRILTKWPKPRTF